ncbi:hypothetical protein ACFLWN_01315 [Chloroflexota bacterium]
MVLGIKNRVAANKPSAPYARYIMGKGILTVFIIIIGAYSPVCFCLNIRKRRKAKIPQPNIIPTADIQILEALTRTMSLLRIEVKVREGTPI